MTAPESATDPPSPETASPPVIEAQRARPALFCLALYIGLVFLAGALIAPRLQATVQFMAEPHRILMGFGPLYDHARSFMATMAGQPFFRFVGRCLLLLGFLGLPRLFKTLRIKSASELGLKADLRNGGDALHGLVWGFAALAFAVAITVSLHFRLFDLSHSAAEWSRHLRGAAISAVIVSTLEEILFRGALFGILRREHPFWAAATISSVIYAYLHFFGHPAEPEEVRWYSGLVVLIQMLSGFTDLGALVPAFFNLFLLGVILCLGLERTSSLLFSIGYHSACVFWMKLFEFGTKEAPAAGSSMFGSGRLVENWSTTLVLVLMLIALKQTLPVRKKDEA